MNGFLGTISAIALSAGAVSAQTALCTGVSEGAWIGGDRESSEVSQASEYIESLSLAPAGEKIVTLFTVSEAAELRLEAQASGSSADTVIELFDTNGLSLASDDDSGGGFDSRIETYLEPGDYCLTTGSFDDGIVGAKVRVGLTSHEPLTIGSPDLLGLSACDGEGTPSLRVAPDEAGKFDRQIIEINAIDTEFVKLEVAGTVPLLLEARNEQADPVLTLIGPDGVIDENDDYDGLDAGLEISEGLEPGSYCLQIDALSDTSAPIELSAMELDPKALLLRDYASGVTPPPMDGSYPVRELGTLSTRLRAEGNSEGDAQWFSFTVDEASLVAIEAVAPQGGDPAVRLFDHLGRELAYHDDISGDDFNALLYQELFPGDYLVAVSNISEEKGNLRVELRRYLPARD